MEAKNSPVYEEFDQFVYTETRENEKNDIDYLKEKIVQQSESYGLDPEIALAIIETESNFKIDAKNEKSTATGLFQITEATKKDFCPKADLLNEDDNINCGFKILKDYGVGKWESSIKVWLPRLATSTREKIEMLGSCMKGLASWGVFIKGDAIDLYPNSQPFVGGVALFRYGKIGHAALITGFTKTGFKVKETNYRPYAYSERTISFLDKNLIGFYDPKLK